MSSRDIAPLRPPLDRCMAPVPKRPGEGSDAAEKVDNVIGRFHAPAVHKMRTPVNVESVRNLFQDFPMQKNSTVGERFNALRERAGISMEKLARAMGLAGRSGVQRYLEPHYNPDGGLPPDKLEAALHALIGKGNPPITEEDVLSLGSKLVQRAPRPPALTIADLCSNAGAMRAIVDGLIEGYEKTPPELRPHAPEVLALALSRVLLRVSERPETPGNPDVIREALVVASSMPPFPTQQ